MAMESENMIGCWDVGIGVGNTVLDFCNNLINLMESDVKPEITGEKRPYDRRDIVLNSDRLLAWGFSFKYCLMDGLNQYVKWFKEAVK